MLAGPCESSFDHLCGYPKVRLWVILMTAPCLLPSASCLLPPAHTLFPDMSFPSTTARTMRPPISHSVVSAPLRNRYGISRPSYPPPPYPPPPYPPPRNPLYHSISCERLSLQNCRRNFGIICRLVTLVCRRGGGWGEGRMGREIPRHHPCPSCPSCPSCASYAFRAAFDKPL